MKNREISAKPVSTTPKAEMLAGARDTIPLIIGAIPFGIIFGTLAVPSGLSFGATLCMSLFVFAGSAQFIALGLVSAGAALPIIVVTTFVVNLRHLLYTATLLPFLKPLSGCWKAALAFWLTDETFVVAAKRFHQQDASPHKHWYQLGSSIAMYSNWFVCTLIGLTAGNMVPNIKSWGLEFAMPATFIGIVMPFLKNWPMWCAVFTAGLMALAGHTWPYNLGLITAAISGVAAGIGSELYLERKKGKNE
jgi:4-azaleucine resistance transporter AzlC